MPPENKPRTLSQRPYLIRALYQWVVDCGMTPYMVVAADVPGVEVPRQHVQKNGQIVFNLSPMALGGINLDTDPVWFNARFGGRPMDCFVPSGAVLAIYAQEIGEGMQFGPPELAADGAAPAVVAPPAPAPAPARPGLSIVSSGAGEGEKKDPPTPAVAATTDGAAPPPPDASPAVTDAAPGPGDDEPPPPPRGGRGHLRVVK